MSALQKTFRNSEPDMSGAFAETDRLILCSAAASGDTAGPPALDLVVMAKADRHMVARMTFTASRDQEARLVLSLGRGNATAELVAEAARVAVPMARRALGARVLRASARAGDQGTIGALCRIGLQVRGGLPRIRAADGVVQFEKDLCGIM
jgi:hypothetical protein